MNNKTYIYTLSDPRDCIVRYVGQTRTPKMRKQSHERVSNSEGQPKLREWKRSLISAGIVPEFVVIMICPANRGRVYEKMVINRYKELGNDLLNVR